MEETIELVVNDTVREIERVIKSTNEWRLNPGSRVNPREAALVITKLEEAQMWAYRMVKQNDSKE